MESDPGHGDASPRDERAVGPFDEAEAALARREAFDAQAWEAALADKTALAPAPEPWAPELDEAMLRRLRRASAVLISDDDGGRVEASLRPADNPDPQGSFGFIDAFLAVTADEEFRAATLVLRTERDKIGPIVTETLRVFRWDEDARRYRRVTPSGVASDGSYLWGESGQRGSTPSWAFTRTCSSCTP